MPVDYHSHTVLCHHAWGTVDEYISRAKEIGLREFGFAEHSHWMVAVDRRCLFPSRYEMDRYLAWMEEARARWNRPGENFTLRVGIEADWNPARLEEAKSFIAATPFDYVLGSVHHLVNPTTGQWTNAWWFETTDLDAYYTAYFDEVAKLAQSGLCDILAHLDVPVRSRKLPPSGVLAHVQRILPALVDSGVAIEINASGRDHANAHFFPSQDVLRAVVAAGIQVTIGSDSHFPNHVGRHRPEVYAALRDAGVKQVLRFERRERELIDLPPSE
jgi:histidinol-phosphatase (PHP family)